MKKTVVLILNFNGLHHLKDCLKSLFYQTYQDFEAILVDNASTDGSKEFVKKHYPQITIIANKKNIGAAGGWYVGSKFIRDSRKEAKFIVTLNNDVRLDKKFLEEGIRILKKRKKIWFVAPKMYLFYSKKLLNAAGDVFYWRGWAENIGYGKKDSPEYNKEKYVFGVCTAGTFLRGGVFERVGLFDPDFFYPLDDVEFFFRMQLQGLKGIYSPKPIIWHKHGATTKKMREYNFNAYGYRNAIYIIIKCYPIKFLITKSPKVIKNQIEILLKAIKSRNLKDYFKIYYDIISNLPRMLKKRKEIQRQRTVSDEYLESIIKD